MRACILTITDYNVGNRLQNLAVQEYLKSQGIEEVYTLTPLAFDFREKQLPTLFQTLSNKIKSFHNKRLGFRRAVKKKDNENISAYDEFNKHINFYTYKYNSHSSLYFLNDLFDIFITGSDQVFNPDFFSDDLTNLMLGFVNESKVKIAMSPSIAIDNLNDDFKCSVKKYLPSFDGLSCRETQGSKLIEQVTGKKCQTLIDPTFMFDANFYKTLEKKPDNIPDKPYIFVYSLGQDNRKIYKKIEKIAQKENLAVVELQSNYGPSQFLYAISHAQIVITNSFHGCVFSFIYHRPLYIFKRIDSSNMFSRIETLFETLNLDYRDYLVDNKNLFQYLSHSNFFDAIDKRRDALKKKYDQYFSESLEKGLERIKHVNFDNHSFNNPLVIRHKEECCGCFGCVQACPVSAISMIKNSDGFSYPQVNLEVCIHCGKCKQVCPMYHPLTQVKPLNIGYLAYSKSEEVLKHSSSGGLFYEMALEVLNKGGYVCGCVSDNNGLDAKHIITNKKNEVEKMCFSKYIQSDINDCYNQIKDLLKQNKLVLFSGTPCQCVALQRVLNDKPHNLIIVDLFCHGVASKTELDRLNKKGISSIQFRHKEKNWQNVSNMKINGKLTKRSDFLDLFHGDVIMMDACSYCAIKGTKRVSDITIGDFWNIEEVLHIPSDKGKSLAIVNTIAGQELLNHLVGRVCFQKLSDQELETALKFNPNYNVAISGINIYDYDISFSKTYRKRFLLRKRIKRLLRR